MTFPEDNGAKAVPTKKFFVSMLTRDISLEDAILDLLDNCLDGALRASEDNKVDYSNYRVDITLSKSDFIISDNCGGIPRNIAKNYAFKMGREDDDSRDNNNETIGMYGVGMKRAIFKMGRDANVLTRHEEDSFSVRISPGWLEDKEWKPLPIQDLNDSNPLDSPGTDISVSSLYPGVSKHFTNDSFINELKMGISEHFTLFLQRGLTVTVNSKKVDPVKVTVLVNREDEKLPSPYVFQKTIDDVEVTITVGLNTGKPLPGDDQDQDDASNFEKERSHRTAGWTVFCNDRAVIVGDKSRLTGWGDGLPLYHYQFSVITGMIEFRSKHASSLPVTTTKRALDTSSNVWLESLVKMKEGMRIWVNYTNTWKNYPRENQTIYWKDAKPMPLREVFSTLQSRAKVSRKDGSIEFNPSKQKIIPKPKGATPSSKRIIFSKPAEEVRLVSEYLFQDQGVKPGTVGEKCFNLILSEAEDSEG